ncbi:MAG: metal ABC transporter permease [Acidobacteriota bacterium]|nr:metal ABC transporter permease [Acidobacteriota bacterium]
MSLFDLWLWPLLAIVLLPGILVYFGLHVVERGVIFVDLALAQIAALGVCVAIVIGTHQGHHPHTYLWSLAFTLIGAAIFSMTRFHHARVPQEAVIGIIYVVSAAAATLVLSRSAEGDEALKSLLLGDVLLVRRSDVLWTFFLYVVITVFHFVLRDKFLSITFHEKRALPMGGARLRLWDFLFYGTFGLVVTSFVQIAGVYLVFSYLIVPAVCGALLSARILGRLVIGWAIALVAGVAGLLVSVNAEGLDLPTGPTIVCMLGLSLILSAGLARLKRT